MGQVALGFKNLFIKFVIFVIMAALLAWALGGTLLPRPKRADFVDSAVQFAGQTWHWRLLLSDTDHGPSMQWTLMANDEPWQNERIAADPFWNDHAGLVATDDALYFAGLRADVDGQPWWFLVRIPADGASSFYLLHDRLAVEQQLERLRNGMPLQSQQAILQQREQVLDPAERESDDAEH